MYQFDSQANLIIQAFIVIIIIGVIYNLIATTQVYGGIIGKAIRFIGIGMVFLAIASIERVLNNFGIIMANVMTTMIIDSLSLIGLTFLALGFSKLGSATKV